MITTEQMLIRKKRCTWREKNASASYFSWACEGKTLAIRDFPRNLCGRNLLQKRSHLLLIKERCDVKDLELNLLPWNLYDPEHVLAENARTASGYDDYDSERLNNLNRDKRWRLLFLVINSIEQYPWNRDYLQCNDIFGKINATPFR